MEISVIVPVYNVENYLGQCIQSIASQTFQDYEVIFVDDGSTDGSGAQCIEWTEKDSRFRYFYQKNQGLSAARNFGITKARGRYLAFIDSDDWIEPDYLKLMYEMAEKDNADIAECEVCRYNSNTGKKTYRRTYGCMEKEYTKIERIKYGYSQIWKTLTKRELWTKNKIFFPHCFAQSRGIYALLIALANKIVVVRQPLYVYRKFRKDSISERGYITAKRIKELKDDINSVEGIYAYKNLLKEFSRCGVYEKYKDIIEEMIKFKSGDMLASLFVERDVKSYLPKASAYKELIGSCFPNSKQISYAVLGGYNLDRITWHMNLLHNPYMRFNFSGLISITHPVKYSKQYSHKNIYRSIMIERDVTASFWDIMLQERPHLLVIDFIDDRFDVIKLQDGYITKSDALEEIGIGSDIGEIIKWGSEEYEILWKNSCRAFIERVNKELSVSKIILVENYLSEYKGDLYNKDKYIYAEEIMKKNDVLKKFYEFFVSECAGVEVISPSNLELYYTDKEYEYGVIPSHLNDIVNRQIAKQIEEKIGINSSAV